MKYLLPILLLLIGCKSEPEKYSIPQLKHELDSVFYLDQWVRKISHRIDDSTVKDSLAKTWDVAPYEVAVYHDSHWRAIDSTNHMLPDSIYY